MTMKKVMIYDSQNRNIVCSKLHSNQQNLTYATVKLCITFANRVISKHLLNRMHAHVLQLSPKAQFAELHKRNRRTQRTR